MSSQNSALKKKNGKISTKSIAVTGITAAVYMAATLAIAPLGFGPVQLRFSEVMVLLAFIDPGYVPGLILGCAFANCFSPMGIADVIIGTFATACTLYAITKTKNLFIATLWPTVFCVFIGIELYVVIGSPLLLTTLTIMIGEFAVVSCIGYPLFKKIISNGAVMEMIKLRL